MVTRCSLSLLPSLYVLACLWLAVDSSARIRRQDYYEVDESLENRGVPSDPKKIFVSQRANLYYEGKQKEDIFF
ncbi:unnamed protein product, partial [Mesorhabditis spiculigera]